MEVKVYPAIYIMGASCELMDEVRAQTNTWADGDENICMTYENASEIEELKPFLQTTFAGYDIILSL